MLSTGIALPPDADGLRRYVGGLAAAGVSALAVELGSRYVRALPAALVDAAAGHRVPLIVFERETQFIAITEAVHARILASQVAELSAAERLYQVFTDLVLAGASEQEVVEQASALAGAPVLLADLAHRVLACAQAGQQVPALLAGFAGRSRAVPVTGRTAYDATSGWLVAPVRSDEEWGRLIFVLPAAPGPAQVALAERAATTVALARKAGGRQGGRLDRVPERPEQTAQRGLLAVLTGSGYADPVSLQAKVTAVGVPLTGRLLPVMIRLASGADAEVPEEVAAVTAEAEAVLAAGCAAAGVPALCGVLDGCRVAGLLALPAGADADRVLRGLAEALAAVGRPAAALAIGTAWPVPTLAQARTAIREADEAAAAALRCGDRRPFVRLCDLGLAGLLYHLRDDRAVVAFAERQLGPLLRHDDSAGTDLTRILAIYLGAGASKAVAAQQAGLARPTLYQRLRQIEQVLGRSLDSPATRLDLQAALLARTC